MVNQVLMFLGLIGVIGDPTTADLGYSERAMGYEDAEQTVRTSEYMLGYSVSVWSLPSGSGLFLVVEKTVE